MSHNKPTTEQIQITDDKTLDQAIDPNGAWVGNSDIPQNRQTVAYGLVLSDRGKHISTNSNVVIPANSAVAFPVGSAVTIYNEHSANITISITSDTLILAASSNAASLNLSSNGVATVLKVADTKWVGTGSGLRR